MPSKPERWFNKPIRLGNLMPGSKQKVRTSYQLTAKGRIKAEEVNVSGAKGEIVMALDNSESPSTVNELANATSLPTQRVRLTIDSLVRDGWVMKMSAGEQ